MPEKAGGMGLHGRVQPPAEEWIRAIQENPEKFPMLNNYIWANELHADRRMKFNEYLRQSAPIISGTLIGGVLGYFAARRFSATQGVMTRGKFIKTVATGAGLLATGRVADIFSTRRVLTRFEESLGTIREHPAFQGLPKEVQRKIMPQLGAIEANPMIDTRIGDQKNPAVATGMAAAETAGLTALAGTLAAQFRGAQALLRLFDEKGRTERKPIGRRVFLATAGSATAAFLYVTQSNVRVGNFLKEHPKLIEAELNELHGMMGPQGRID
ncbi:MAG: hypothetical protein V1708_03305 [Candidatus Micrarchaeota archaeon]